MKNLVVGQKIDAKRALEIYRSQNVDHGIFNDFFNGEESIENGIEYEFYKNNEGQPYLKFEKEVVCGKYIHRDEKLIPLFSHC